MKKFLTKKNIGLVLLLVLVISQFIPIDKTNPPLEPANDFLVLTNADAKMATLFQSSCYDCHSHTTEYPWYTNVSPFSFWIAGHIRNARKNTNYSTWGDYTKNEKLARLQTTIEVISEKRMPAASYMMMHAQAKLSDENRTEMVDWLTKVQNEL